MTSFMSAFRALIPDFAFSRFISSLYYLYNWQAVLGLRQAIDLRSRITAKPPSFLTALLLSESKDVALPPLSSRPRDTSYQELSLA